MEIVLAVRFRLEAYRAPLLYELSLASNLLTGDLSTELASSKIQLFSVTLNKLGGPGMNLNDAIKNDPRFKIFMVGQE